MGQKRMVDLDVFETSGVDHPAHLHEGFAVMKSSDPHKASALMRVLGKETSMTTKTAATTAPASKSLADILALGDGAFAVAKEPDVAKAIDTKLQAALDTLAEAWQSLRTYAESQDDATPSAGTSTAEPEPEVDPTLAAAAEAAGLDPALAKSTDPSVQAMLKAVSSQIAKAQAEAAEAHTVAKAERDARLDSEAVAKSRETFGNLALAHDTVAPALRRLALMDADTHKAVTELLVSVNAQMDGAALTKELGTPGHTGTGSTVWDQIEDMAKAKVTADPTLTIQKARTLVFDENPALQAAYQKENAR